MNWLSGAAVIALAIVVSLEVVARYFFGAPTTWVYDVALLLFAAISFGPSLLLARDDGHIKIDFITRMLPRGPRKFLAGVLTVFCMAMPLGLAWSSVRETIKSFNLGVTSPTLWAPPMWPFYAILSVGCVSCFIGLLFLAAKYFRRNENSGRQ